MITHKFQLGQLVATTNAADQLPPDDVAKAIARHASGDWGECCPEDKAANDQALADGITGEGGRLFSVYMSSKGIKFWIITEWDRSATTVLLPEDY